VDLEMMLRAFCGEMGLGPAIPADRWRAAVWFCDPAGRPSGEELADRTFYKVAMVGTACAFSSSRSTARVCPRTKVKLRVHHRLLWNATASMSCSRRRDRFKERGEG
jgi:hypothetical protein